ncbi:MAG: ABC transporter permease [Thermodesulfobacteriota bacterium]
MRRYLIKRLAHTLLVLFGVSVITFFVARVIPGSPEAVWIGAKPTQAQLDEARRELGLDKPLVVQYLVYVSRLARGDLGISLRTRRRVSEELATRWAATFELVTVSILVALVVGLPLGVLSATHKDRPVDHLSRATSISGVAMPVFWLGLILQMLLHGEAGLFPLQGRIGSQVLVDHPLRHVTGLYLVDALVTGNWPAFVSASIHLVLPTLTLSFASLAVVTRMSRSSMLEVLREDYIQTAWAYGVSRAAVLYRYALKNALIPTVTVVGLSYGLLLGGSFMVESIFDWPGLGRYAVLSLTTNDFPAIMGVTILFAGTYIALNTAVDLIYYLLDPRIKTPGR